MLRLQDVRHFTEVVRHQVAVPGQVRFATGGRQEIADVSQMVTELAVDIAPFPQRVHLMNPHALQLLGVFLQRVDQLGRLTIRVGHDDVGARLDVVQNALKGQLTWMRSWCRHLFLPAFGCRFARHVIS